MDTQQESSAPAVLNYGVATNFITRRRLTRIAVVMVVVGVCTWLGFHFLTPVVNQAAHLWLQRRISHQVLPAETVIFTEDPARIAKLRNLPGYRGKRETWGDSYSASFPDAWERTYSNDSFEARDGPVSVGRFQVNDTFSYLRTSSDGIDWIVHLAQVNPFEGNRGRRKVCITQGAFTPVGWQLGSRGANVSFMSEEILLEPSDRLTVFAPQPDPMDRSRINVTCEINGQPGVLTGVVTHRGYVQFSNQSGPAKVVKWNE